MGSARYFLLSLIGVHTSEFNGDSYRSSTPVKPEKRAIELIGLDGKIKCQRRLKLEGRVQG